MGGIDLGIPPGTGATGATGPTGPTGATGATGPAGTTLHAGLSDVSANQHHAQLHAASHAPGGSDATLLAIRSTSDQNIPGATLVNVTGMVLPVAANQVLTFDTFIVYDSTTANDVQFGFTVPSGATLLWGGIGIATTAVNTATSAVFAARASSVVTYGGTRATGAGRSRTTVVLRGTVANGSTAGNLQLQAAKLLNTDTATPADDLLIYTNSWLRAASIS